MGADVLAACADGPTGLLGKSDGVRTGDLQALATSVQATDVEFLDGADELARPHLAEALYFRVPENLPQAEEPA